MSDLSDRLRAALADRYTIEREFGHGGMAVVYFAEDRKHRRKVALKVLRPELAASLGAERFLWEIRTAAHLAHPNILPLFDSGEADGTLYSTMPSVDGESLRDCRNREKQLPIDDALLITREVADALGYVHEQGIIQRDIKPEEDSRRTLVVLMTTAGVPTDTLEPGERDSSAHGHVADLHWSAAGRVLHLLTTNSSEGSEHPGSDFLSFTPKPEAFSERLLLLLPGEDSPRALSR